MFAFRVFQFLHTKPLGIGMAICFRPAVFRNPFTIPRFPYSQEHAGGILHLLFFVCSILDPGAVGGVIYPESSCEQKSRRATQSLMNISSWR